MKECYELWVGFRNYKGEIHSLTKIATFYHKNRAEEYLGFCEANADEGVEYVLLDLTASKESI